MEVDDSEECKPSTSAVVPTDERSKSIGNKNGRKTSENATFDGVILHASLEPTSSRSSLTSAFETFSVTEDGSQGDRYGNEVRWNNGNVVDNGSFHRRRSSLWDRFRIISHTFT
ncbi:hypothetical protein AB6A40_010357 [Gnathostoma spinigerum]|uniref:Uncharacterized protein n=1 Tax=Gnathostoma spinigerum TaxID=75299 RepID=A0ABD6EUL7_9BILA